MQVESRIFVESLILQCQILFVILMSLFSTTSEDEETVVCGLFHDVGEIITPSCHGEIGKY